MKIHEISSLGGLQEYYFKFNPNSITIKDSNNTTKAVITGIKKVQQLPFRDKFEVYKRFNNQLSLDIMNDFYIDDNKSLYYFIDYLYMEMIGEHPEYHSSEIEKTNNTIKLLTDHKVNVIVVKFA